MSLRVLGLTIGAVAAILGGGPNPPGANVPNPRTESPPTTPDALTYGLGVFPPGKPPPLEIPSVQIQGTLSVIGPDTVTLSRPGQPDVQATLPPDVTPMLDGHAVPWSAVPLGSQVGMTYVPRGNERVVTDLIASPPSHSDMGP